VYQKNENQFIENCRKFKIEINEFQMNQFRIYYQMLIEWNENVNLTAITEYDEVLVKHFLDSIALCAYTDLSKKKKIIDIGTGAGFPGIPLKIIFPELQVTLLDSLNKRVLFLNTVIEKLRLDNMETVHVRAEDLARDKNYREKYDFSVSRAVANLSTLNELCLPFVKEKGYFVSYKSEKADMEIENAKRSIKLLGGIMEHKYEYILPETDINRTLIFIKKTKKCPALYPRKAGTPTKNPL